MPNTSPSHLTDQELLEATARVAGSERRTTAELVALLAEVDVRKLHIGLGYSSPFVYCTSVLRLSEAAAYSRITAARLSRRFPDILPMMAAGDITLTTVSLLAAHLTEENVETLLDSARHKSKRDVERLVASLCAQPDIPASVRRLPSAVATGTRSNQSLALLDAVTNTSRTELPNGDHQPTPTMSSTLNPSPSPAQSRDTVAPIATDRYLLRVTISDTTHAKLERARDLLRHTVPNGDPAAIIDRALEVLIARLERAKLAAVRRPRTVPIRGSQGRHVPAAVRRAVWTRDEGRCAFVGSHGRCGATGFLEFHHVVPFAAGGPTTADNLELRCRAHNAFEAERYFGRSRSGRVGQTAQ